MTRHILAEIDVEAPIERVWEAWTTAAGARTFFAPATRVEARPGGAYEMLFDPDAAPGSRGSEGAVILALQPPRMLSFTWNAPPELASVRGQATHVTVRLTPVGEVRTHVTLTHDGWGEGGEWDEAYRYFDRV